MKFGSEKVLPGERKQIYIDVASMYDYTKLTIPVEVIRGNEPGPTLFVSAAIHGDEINGVEIAKRLLKRVDLARVRGTLIVVPVVNVFGFNNKSRYLPDRRDLNRSFPGSVAGSMASRLAAVFMKEIVSKCTHGIDLHTGAIHRSNLPQIRACLDDAETEVLARCFGVPVVLHSKLRDGSLREAARKKRVKVLLFEGGEALRFEEDVIRIGVRGCLSVMRKIGMLPASEKIPKGGPKKVYVPKQSYWARATHGGSFRAIKKLGDRVKDGERLGVITDLFGCDPYVVRAEEGGIIIGLSRIPLVNKGDAMFHIATFKNSMRVKMAIDEFDDEVLL